MDIVLIFVRTNAFEISCKIEFFELLVNISFNKEFSTQQCEISSILKALITLKNLPIFTDYLMC